MLLMIYPFGARPNNIAKGNCSEVRVQRQYSDASHLIDVHDLLEMPSSTISQLHADTIRTTSKFCVLAGMQRRDGSALIHNQPALALRFRLSDSRLAIELEGRGMGTVTSERLGEEMLRWSLVVIFALFGTAKFAAYEAAGVATIAKDYWLFFWLYPLGGEQFASNVIGTLELTTGLLLAVGSRYNLASLAGAAMGVCTFLVTLSFLLIAPTTFEEGYGFPFLGSSGQFLMKDLVLLAACANLALVAARRIRARADSSRAAG